jgi:hypothetical protein
MRYQLRGEELLQIAGTDEEYAGKAKREQQDDACRYLFVECHLL